MKLSLFQSDIVSLCRFLSFSGVFECDYACARVCVCTYKPKGERHQTEQKLHKSLCKSTHKFVHLKFSNTQNFPSVGFSLSGNFLSLLLLLFSFLLCAGCVFFLHWRYIFMNHNFAYEVKEAILHCYLFPLGRVSLVTANFVCVLSVHLHFIITKHPGQFFFILSMNFNIWNFRIGLEYNLFWYKFFVMNRIE